MRQIPRNPDRAVQFVAEEPLVQHHGQRKVNWRPIRPCLARRASASSGPVSRHALPRVGGVASALHRVEQRLVAAGLLLTAQRGQRIRLAGAWVFAVVALGVLLYGFIWEAEG